MKITFLIKLPSTNVLSKHYQIAPYLLQQLTTFTGELSMLIFLPIPPNQLQDTLSLAIHCKKALDQCEQQDQCWIILQQAELTLPRTKTYYSSRPGCRQNEVQLIHFFGVILMFHQYSVSKIRIYHTFHQDSIRRDPGLELQKALQELGSPDNTCVYGRVYSCLAKCGYSLVYIVYSCLAKFVHSMVYIVYSCLAMCVYSMVYIVYSCLAKCVYSMVQCTVALLSVFTV